MPTISDIRDTAGIMRVPIAKATERDLLVMILVEFRTLNAQIAANRGCAADLEGLRVDEAYDLST